MLCVHDSPYLLLLRARTRVRGFPSRRSECVLGQFITLEILIFSLVRNAIWQIALHWKMQEAPMPGKQLQENCKTSVNLLHFLRTPAIL